MQVGTNFTLKKNACVCAGKSLQNPNCLGSSEADCGAALDCESLLQYFLHYLNILCSFKMLLQYIRFENLNVSAKEVPDHSSSALQQKPDDKYRLWSYTI